MILWGLPARQIVSKFVKWVFLPAGFALVGFQVLLIATRQQRNAFFDAFTVAANVPVPTMRPWFLTLGEGIYLSLGGLLVLAGALILVRQQKVSLPLRFRRSAQAASAHDAETVRDARDVFVFLIVMAVWTLGVSFLLFAPVLIRGYWSWHYGNFDFLEWVPALVNAAAAACIALIFLRKTRRNALDLLLPKRPPRDYALAVAIPLVVVLIPRFLLGALFQPDRWTPGPSQLFIPHPLPWVLAIFVIAFFEEFAVRGYLQTTLEQYLSLNRSIFVTGLLWRLLPMGFGMTHSLVEAKDYALVPGLPYLTSLATLLIYSVPLGWLYARTRSVVAVALMHGTIAVFHVGLGDKIHLNRPEFYWLELALWIFIGWYLMGERRYVMPSVQRT